MALINQIGISGGKDSTALLLWAVYESGYPQESIRATFCDTGNEHAFTYEHIEYLSRHVWPIETIHPSRDFWTLAKDKRRFPSVKARFCTQFLKVIPTRQHLLDLVHQGHEVVSHSGVRADESLARRGLPEFEYDLEIGSKIRRPLIAWELVDVLAIHERYEVPLNPLYAMGAVRVGCWPCIMSRKAELCVIARRFPKRIDEIRRHERALNSTFYPPKMTPSQFHSKRGITKKGRPYTAPTIYDVARWACTSHGGRQYTLDLAEEPMIACDVSGYCE